jgi:hypothetical protein
LGWIRVIPLIFTDWRGKKRRQLEQGAISATGIIEDGHQRVQHCRRWQCMAKNDSVGAHARGKKGARLQHQGENERERSYHGPVKR